MVNRGMKNSATMILNDQYELVKGSRSVLLEYCGTLSAEHLLFQNASFGRGGSIRNLLVHIATTYQFWVGKCGLKQDVLFAEFDQYESLDRIRLLFEKIDHMVNNFLEVAKWDVPITFQINGERGTTTCLALFTHVITHEYHHKGQILSMSRHLAYIPVDTDILR